MKIHHWNAILSRLLCLCCFGLLLTSAGRLAAAQVLYGTVVGNVTDSSNAVIPGASVTLSNRDTNQTHETISSDTGGFTLSNLQPGTYTLKVSLQEFKEYVARDVLVTVNNITRLDVVLQVGSLAETITVAGEGARLQTDAADVRKELSTAEITNLPLNIYRNYQSLLDLVPGTTPGAFQNANVDTPARALTTNINGTVRFNNNTRLDGALNIMPWLPHHTAIVAPQESIQTVSISTNSFDAEQGLAGGAAITVQTKTGTNSFHGVAFEYHRNSALSARNFFTPPGSGVPKYLLNMYGGNIGGPIKREKVFFFANWEGMKDRQSFSGFRTIATPEMRRGNFSATGVRLYDPATGDASGRGRAEFAGAIIPESRISSVARKMLDLIPQPNVGGTYVNNYYTAAPQVFDRDNYDFKIDWVRSPQNTFWGKYSLMDSLVDCRYSLGEAGGPGLCDGGPGRGTVRVHVGTIGGYYTMTPRFLIDGTIGYTRYVNHVRQPDFGVNFGLDTLGIPGTNGPDIRQSGKPQFIIDGNTSLGLTSTWIPVDRWDYTWTFTGNASWSKGRHDIRFGPDISRYAMNHWQPESGNGPRGTFTFNGGVTALNGGVAPNRFNAMAAFLLGLPSQMQKSLQYYDPMSTREWQFGLYLRDRWQATNNLTVTLGIRWEYFPLVTRAHNGIERYDPDENKMYIGGRGGVPDNAGTFVSKKLIAPRLGLAYRLGKQGVIRSGYGITFDPYPLGRPMRSPYPVVIQLALDAPNSFQPFGPIENGIPPIIGPDINQGIIDIPGNFSTSTLPKGLFRRGYIQSWNLTYERELPFSLVGSVGYVATRSIRIFGGFPINNAPVGTGQAGRPLNRKFGRTVGTSINQPWQNAVYDSLQATLDRRFSNGLMSKVVYTWSHVIDAASSPIGVPDLFYRNRAAADFDRRHNFRTAWIYELPFGPNKRWAQDGLAGRLFSGWQVNGIFSAVSGTPFTVGSSGASLNAPGSNQVADQVKPTVEKLGEVGVGVPFFDPLAFRPVTEVRFGNTGRNILYGLGIVNVDFGAFRNFKVSERVEMEFRGEVLNLTNTPHFNNPSASASDMSFNPDGSLRSSGNFMSITSALQDQRSFRFGLRISF